MTKRRRPMVWGIPDEETPHVYLSCSEGHVERLTLDQAGELLHDLARLLIKSGSDEPRWGLPEGPISGV